MDAPSTDDRPDPPAEVATPRAGRPPSFKRLGPLFLLVAVAILAARSWAHYVAMTRKADGFAILGRAYADRAEVAGAGLAEAERKVAAGDDPDAPRRKAWWAGQVEHNREFARLYDDLARQHRAASKKAWQAAPAVPPLPGKEPPMPRPGATSLPRA